MMNTRKIIAELDTLLQMDYDTVRFYEQALEKIDDETINNALSNFRNDHNRHVTDLSNTIRSLGGEPLPGGKGFASEGFSVMRRAAGTKETLESLFANEKIASKAYADAAKMDFPESIRIYIENNYGDEQRHLVYIESALNVTVGAR